MNSTIKPKPCKQCGSLWHSAMYHKPRKPIKSNNKPLKRSPLPAPKKRINQRGKHYNKWQETRELWFKMHPAEVYFCYLQISPDCKMAISKAETTLDHVKSRSSRPDLRYDLSNLKPCCWPCNGAKGSKSLNVLK